MSSTNALQKPISTQIDEFTQAFVKRALDNYDPEFQSLEGDQWREGVRKELALVTALSSLRTLEEAWAYLEGFKEPVAKHLYEAVVERRMSGVLTVLKSAGESTRKAVGAIQSMKRDPLAQGWETRTAIRDALDQYQAALEKLDEVMAAIRREAK